MKETQWTGPRGTLVTTTNGSSKPPRWALLLIDRVRGGGWIDVRWTVSSRGSHGRCYGSHLIAVHPDASDDRTRYILIHELAHASNRRGDRHGDGFYERLVAIAYREGCIRLVRREHRYHVKAPLTRAIRRYREAKAIHAKFLNTSSLRA